MSSKKITFVIKKKKGEREWEGEGEGAVMKCYIRTL